MRKKIKILLFILLGGNINAIMLPENNSSLNYTQVFFVWNQIPEALSYEFKIINILSNEEQHFNIFENSILLTHHLDWNNSYAWSVCGILDIDEPPVCLETFTLNINALPDYFPNNISILHSDQSLSQPGITIMDFESLDFSGGLDYYGNPIWFADKNNFQTRFVFTQFLKNGNIIGFGPGKGYEINLDGNIIFETPNGYDIHHDFNKTRHNTYFTVTAIVENQYCPEECNPLLPDEIPWQGDAFIEFDKDGNELWRWNTFNHFNLTEYNPYYVEIYTGNLEMDWTHSNSVFFDYYTESVFVSIRNLSRITKIDYSSKDIIWNLGETEYMNNIFFEEDLNFSQQHSVQILDNTNLLFFDNHRFLSPELSRCIEVSYNESLHSAEIIWQHTLPADLFTGSRGECDRLENGNTLITAGRTGNIIEVTSDNTIAWQIDVDNSEVDVNIYRSSRIPNLYPIAFSTEIISLNGNIDEYYIESVNNIVNCNIHNLGWAKGWYNYSILNLSGNELISDSIWVESIGVTPFNIDVNMLQSSTYTLKVYPQFGEDKMQSIEFNLYNNISLGDLNNDGILNVLDIVLLANLALSGNTNISGDINQDGVINILDVVNLLNLILDI